MKFNSKEYWEKRYKSGGNSGNGSYGDIAKIKSEFLTDFIHKNNIKKLVEYGCGDGNNLLITSTMNPKLEIIGVDVSEKAIDLCKNKMPNHSFYHKSNFINKGGVDLVVSLEVIFHLIEDDVYEDYMESITSMGTKWIIILSPDEDNNNYNIHVKSRKYSNSICLNNKYELIERVDFKKSKRDYKDGSFSDWTIWKNREC